MEDIKISPEDLAKVLAHVRKKGAVFRDDLVEITQEELSLERKGDAEPVASLLEFRGYFEKSKVGHSGNEALVSDKEIVFTVNNNGAEFINQYL